MFLREAFSVFKARYPEIIIGFTAFCKLRPKNVLLKNTPMDQCICKVNENFILKLSAVNINYHNFWEKSLCEGHSQIFTSSCWAGECQECLGGKKIPFIELPIDQIITYNEWIVDGDNSQQCMVKTCTTQLLQSLVMNYYPTFQQHVRIKQIQEARFLEDKAKANVGISQIDFAMVYSCEYQNEIQSALWTRATINLFTLARFVNQEVTCHLFVLDNYKKDKDAICACLQKFCGDTTELECEFKSEFKNQYMMKLLHHVNKQYSARFTWDYFATGHGKGMVD